MYVAFKHLKGILAALRRKLLCMRDGAFYRKLLCMREA